MDNIIKKAFMKAAMKVGFKTPSFGSSLRGSAFAKPSKTVTVNTPKFSLAKGNSKSGYSSGGTASIKTNGY